MQVKELIAILADIPDDWEVMVTYIGHNGDTVLDQIGGWSLNGEGIQLDAQEWTKTNYV